MGGERSDINRAVDLRNISIKGKGKVINPRTKEEDRGGESTWIKQEVEFLGCLNRAAEKKEGRKCKINRNTKVLNR